eukprot:1587923-Prymnesium_polylepis.1
MSAGTSTSGTSTSGTAGGEAAVPASPEVWGYAWSAVGQWEGAAHGNARALGRRAAMFTGVATGVVATPALGRVGDRLLLHAALRLGGEVGLPLERLLLLLVRLLVEPLLLLVRRLAHLDELRPLGLLLRDLAQRALLLALRSDAACEEQHGRGRRARAQRARAWRRAYLLHGLLDARALRLGRRRGERLLVADAREQHTVRRRDELAAARRHLGHGLAALLLELLGLHLGRLRRLLLLLRLAVRADHADEVGLRERALGCVEQQILVVLLALGEDLGDKVWRHLDLLEEDELGAERADLCHTRVETALAGKPGSARVCARAEGLSPLARAFFFLPCLSSTRSELSSTPSMRPRHASSLSIRRPPSRSGRASSWPSRAPRPRLTRRAAVCAASRPRRRWPASPPPPWPRAAWPASRRRGRSSSACAAASRPRPPSRRRGGAAERGHRARRSASLP